MVTETDSTATERARNEILRRADWRFLLPNPYPRTTFCLAHGALQRAVCTISERVAYEPTGGVCDLAVATNPRDPELQSLACALREGGSLYMEWNSVRGGDGQNIRRKLQAHGFRDVRFYWTPRAPAAFWLPLESRNALNYFFQSRPRKLFRPVTAFIWNAARTRGWMRPLSVTARKGNVSTASDALNIDELISENMRESFSRLLLTGGERTINKVVLLAFEENATQPRVAVKMPRVRETDAALAHEKKVLDALNAQNVRGIPRVVNSIQRDDVLILAESVVTGAPLYTKLNRDTHRALAFQATDWLIQLARAPRSRTRDEWHTRIVEPALSAFEHNFGAVADAALLQTTRTLLDSLEIPGLVTEQRDFSPWNVMVQADGELAVLDWESAELCGLPALDLIYFQTYLAFFLDGAMRTKRFVDSYRALLNANTFTGSVFAECISRYAHAVGLGVRHSRALRVLTWLIHARSEFARLRADCGGDVPRAKLGNALFLNLWRQELLEHNAVFA